MKPMKWTERMFVFTRPVIAMPVNAARQVIHKEPGRSGSARLDYAVAVSIVWLIVVALILRAANGATPGTGPTAENALAAEQELARALETNDADAVARWLDDDWAVVSAYGGVAEGPARFVAAIKSGAFTRKTMEISEPRVRLNGNMALVTSKVKTSGMYGGKPFNVQERQTDVLIWRDGGWKSVLTQETLLHE